MASPIRRYIPVCEAYGWQGGPTFSTRTVTMANGRERRNADWAQAKHSYMLSFQNISQPMYAALKNHHSVCMGKLRTFLYFDVLDHDAEGELIAVATAGQTEFQLSKLSELDGVYYQRLVFALYTPGDNGEAVPAVPVIRVDGVITAPSSVDYDRGTVVFPAMAGGEEITWSGEFSVWVHFNQDNLPMSIDNRRGDSYAINGSVELVEDAAPEEVVS